MPPVQVLLLGSKCCAVTYCNTTTEACVLRKDLSQHQNSLYGHCIDEEGNFNPLKMQNAKLLITTPRRWNEEKGFAKAIHFVDYAASGPVRLVTTRRIDLGEEIIAPYPLPTSSKVNSSYDEDFVESSEPEDHDVGKSDTESETDVFRKAKKKGTEVVTDASQFHQSPSQEAPCGHRVTCSFPG
jgi:hypothetical protein